MRVIFATIIGAAVGMLGYVFVLPLILLSGWVLRILWEWFVVPIFHLPLLSNWQAVGLALVISFVTHQDVDCQSPKRDAEETATRVIIVAMRPLFVLSAAWIIRSML